LFHQISFIYIIRCQTHFLVAHPSLVLLLVAIRGFLCCSHTLHLHRYLVLPVKISIWRSLRE
jgi:hypothetical protein